MVNNPLPIPPLLERKLTYIRFLVNIAYREGSEFDPQFGYIFSIFAGKNITAASTRKSSCRIEADAIVEGVKSANLSMNYLLATKHSQFANSKP